MFTIYATRRLPWVIARFYIKIDLSSNLVALLHCGPSVFTYIVNLPLAKQLVNAWN